MATFMVDSQGEVHYTADTSRKFKIVSKEVKLDFLEKLKASYIEKMTELGHPLKADSVQMAYMPLGPKDKMISFIKVRLDADNPDVKKANEYKRGFYTPENEDEKYYYESILSSKNGWKIEWFALFGYTFTIERNLYDLKPFDALDEHAMTAAKLLAKFHDENEDRSKITSPFYNYFIYTGERNIRTLLSNAFEVPQQHLSMFKLATEIPLENPAAKHDLSFMEDLLVASVDCQFAKDTFSNKEQKVSCVEANEMTQRLLYINDFRFRGNVYEIYNNFKEHLKEKEPTLDVKYKGSRLLFTERIDEERLKNDKNYHPYRRPIIAHICQVQDKIFFVTKIGLLSTDGLKHYLANKEWLFMTDVGALLIPNEYDNVYDYKAELSKQAEFERRRLVMEGKKDEITNENEETKRKLSPRERWGRRKQSIKEDR